MDELKFTIRNEELMNYLKTEIEFKYIQKENETLKNQLGDMRLALLETNFNDTYIDMPLDEFTRLGAYTFGLKNLETVLNVLTIQEIKSYLRFKWNEYHAESQEVSEDE